MDAFERPQASHQSFDLVAVPVDRDRFETEVVAQVDVLDRDDGLAELVLERSRIVGGPGFVGS